MPFHKLDLPINFFLVLLVVFTAYSCNNGGHEQCPDVDSAAVARAFFEKHEKGPSITPGSQTFVSVRTKKESVEDGDEFISNYIKNPITDIGFMGYLIKADELKALLNENTVGDGFIHVSLARRTDNPKKLTLVISGVRANGDHYVIPKAGTMGNILESVIPCPECLVGPKQKVQDQLLNGGKLTTGLTLP